MIKKTNFKRKIILMYFGILFLYFFFYSVCFLSFNVSLNAFLSIFLYLATLTDIKYGKIPNFITFPLYISGFILGLFLNGTSFLINIFLVTIGLFCFSFFKLMGFGDIKMWMGIALLMGFKNSLIIVFFGELFFVIYSIINSETKKDLKTDILGITKIHSYPFAPFIFLGEIIREIIM